MHMSLTIILVIKCYDLDLARLLFIAMCGKLSKFLIIAAYSQTQKLHIYLTDFNTV